MEQHLMASLFQTVAGDLRRKALWCYESDRPAAIVQVLFSDGTMAMIYYRLMQWSRKYRLVPLECIFNKLNAIFCNCVVGRGAEFGPGLVLVHSSGILINGKVRGGANVTIYQQVSLGGERDQVPILGNDVVVTAGAKVVGPFKIGDGARIAANSVVLRNVPPHTTVMGVPAVPIWQAKSAPQGPTTNANSNGSANASANGTAEARVGI
jgi:serine O-acetyltransferase